MVTEGDLLHRAETGTERRQPRWLDFLMSRAGSPATTPTPMRARSAHDSDCRIRDAAGPARPGSVADGAAPRQTRADVEGGRLVGIVSCANLVRALVRTMAKPVGRGAISGEQVRNQILEEIAKQPWGPRASAGVQIKDGVAELYGTITDECERAALQVLAESTAGVQSVCDNLVWVEPISGFVVPTDGPRSPPEHRVFGNRSSAVTKLMQISAPTWIASYSIRRLRMEAELLKSQGPDCGGASTAGRK